MIENIRFKLFGLLHDEIMGYLLTTKTIFWPYRRIGHLSHCEERAIHEFVNMILCISTKTTVLHIELP